MQKKQKIKALNFYFVRKSLLSIYLQLVANNFNSFLKLKFFKNVLAEILKINSFSSVVKTKKFKTEVSFVNILQIALTSIKFLIFNIQAFYWYDCEYSKILSFLLGIFSVIFLRAQTIQCSFPLLFNEKVKFGLFDG